MPKVMPAETEDFLFDSVSGLLLRLSSGALVCVFALAATLATPCASAQGSGPNEGGLSAEELFLDPERLEAGIGGITERWRPIRSFMEKGLQTFERGVSQVALTRALLRARGWQTAQEFATAIEEPIWRARALMEIATAQFGVPNGQRFGRENLEKAFSILRSVPEKQLGEEGEQGYRIAGEIFAKQGLFRSVSSYLKTEQQVSPRTRFLEGALPYLSANSLGLLQRDYNAFLNNLLLQATRRSRLDDLLRLSDYSQQQGRNQSSSRLLFEAYRRTLLLPPGERRNTDLVRVARNMLANNAFRDALRAIRRVENVFLQSGLLAETGRRMIRNKMEFAGQPLLSLSNDLARTLEVEQRSKAFTRIAIEYALAGDLEQAWEVLRGIPDTYTRAQGILALALVLAQTNDTERALDMLKFIPDANLRARFVVHSAATLERRIGSRRLSGMLDELTEADDFIAASGFSSLSPRNVEGMLEAQLEHGFGQRNRTIFRQLGARVLSSDLSPFERLRAEVRFLRINARRSPRFADEARTRINTLLRSLWVYYDNPEYFTIVETAVDFFIEQNDLVHAFTLVQTLPKSEFEDEQERRDRLLATVAIQATRRANEDMALRAVASIQRSNNKAETLAKVINIAANIP